MFSNPFWCKIFGHNIKFFKDSIIFGSCKRCNCFLLHNIFSLDIEEIKNEEVPVEYLRG